MAKVVIEGSNLKKTYTLTKTNIIHALRGVDMDVHEGDFTAIVGPSGCGKSTLLHILGLLDTPDAGSLIIDGIDTSRMKEHEAHQIRAHKIGFVFQGFNLIPSLTALENVMLAGKYGGMKLGDRKKHATELLGMMGLADRMDHRPNELSGGQQQRVALARALMNNPSIILADEPTGELDSTTSLEIIATLKKLNEERNQTFVIVTHNNEVANTCKKIVRLKDGRNDQ
ncbi:MAG: ABC transporter ATP-binding protein [Patescibacteria group bacterium]